MTDAIATGAIHHVRLTVTDVERSKQFYTELLGFKVLVELPRHSLVGSEDDDSPFPGVDPLSTGAGRGNRRALRPRR